MQKISLFNFQALYAVCWKWNCYCLVLRGTNQSPSHVFFTNKGIKTIRCVISDALGAISSNVIDIKIEAEEANVIQFESILTKADDDLNKTINALDVSTLHQYVREIGSSKMLNDSKYVNAAFFFYAQYFLRQFVLGV